MGAAQATSGVGTPRLREGKMVPLFYLPSAAGGESGPAALRSKYNMVLLFLEGGPDTEAYLREVATLYRDIEAEQARVIAVVAQPIEEARKLTAQFKLPFTVLADEEGIKTASMLGGPGAALCVADRYGTVAYVEIRERSAQLSSAQTTLDWLDFVQIQCPE
jgi:peroxiredoxin